MLIGEAWGRMAQPALVSFAWAQAYLPFPAVLGPLHFAARFVSGLLILAGFLTRPCGLFVAADMLGEIAIAKLPNSVGLVSWRGTGQC